MNETKLKRTVEHIEYEVMMFRHAANNIARLIQRNDSSPWEMNSYLEVFSIHARNLWEFFYARTAQRKRPDDVLAEDFLEQKKAFLSARTPKRKLQLIPSKTAKQIAHLTYARLRRNKRTKPWNVAQIYVDLERTVDAFKNSLPALRKSWFSNL